jgi:hypothetical protein
MQQNILLEFLFFEFVRILHQKTLIYKYSILEYLLGWVIIIIYLKWWVFLILPTKNVKN